MGQNKSLIIFRGNATSDKSRVDVKDTRIVEFRVSLLSSPSFFSFFFRPSSPFLLFENYPSRGKHEPNLGRSVVLEVYRDIGSDD